jgi:quercetin dioxygenase-like cupin family protein
MTPPGPTPHDPYFVPAGHGSRHEIFPGVTIRTTAGRAMMLSVVTLEPGSVVTEHAHPHEQMGYLISGKLEFTVGGLTRLLGPGDAWKIPGGVLHSVRALNGPALALDVFDPIREDYL